MQIPYSKLGNLCNNAQLGEGGKIYGQPTEMALLDVVFRSNMKDERMVNWSNLKKKFKGGKWLT